MGKRGRRVDIGRKMRRRKGRGRKRGMMTESK
jgi:hypothetical protein